MTAGPPVYRKPPSATNARHTHKNGILVHQSSGAEGGNGRPDNGGNPSLSLVELVLQEGMHKLRVRARAVHLV